MLIIDTHAHIYAGDERRYPPIDKPLRPPGGKGTLGDLRAAASLHGVRGACLIQVLRRARCKNLHAKLTFVPMGTKQKYPCADMHDAVLKIVDAFGAERGVWGSDFPCELWTPGISYSQHLQIFLSDLPLRDQARQQILGLTAKKLWFPEW